MAEALLAEGGPMEHEELEDVVKEKAPAVFVKLRIENKWEEKGIFCQRCHYVFKDKQLMLRHKNSCGAMGSNRQDPEVEQNKGTKNDSVTPVFVRRTSRTDHEKKKDILRKRDSYDISNKVEPCSQYISPLGERKAMTSEGVVSSETMDSPVQFMMNNSRAIIEELPTSVELPIIIEYIESDTANLPPYAEINTLPDTTYNNVSPEIFTTNINKVYEEMVTWRKNHFILPTGKAGKAFIALITEWLGNFNNGNTFQGIAMKVVMVLPNLLLQKPSAKSKAKDHSKALEERLKMWKDGNIQDLLRDCKAVQTKLKSGKKKTTIDITRIFSKLIFEGKIGAALKFFD